MRKEVKIGAIYKVQREKGQKGSNLYLETSKPMSLFGSPYPPKNNNADELTAAKPCPSLLAKLGLGVALSRQYKTQLLYYTGDQDMMDDSSSGIVLISLLYFLDPI